jgi:hypothetical protein
LEYVNSGCDTILVTYTLVGEEPVTVEVEKEDGLLNGKNFYFIPIDPENPEGYPLYCYPDGSIWLLTTGTAYLTEDTECPFGTYTILGGSIFESFVVETVNPKDDWYLPAIDELSLLWQNRFNVNRTLSGNSSLGTIVGATIVSTNTYWSSTEYAATNAWTFNFSNGTVNNGRKDSTYYVRAIRKFSI